MSNPLPTVLNEDTLPVVLKSIGAPLKGDGQLHLLAGMPLRVHDAVASAALTAATTAAGTPAPDVARITAELTKRKALK
jgi:hypothetical protein